MSMTTTGCHQKEILPNRVKYVAVDPGWHNMGISFVTVDGTDGRFYVKTCVTHLLLKNEKIPKSLMPRKKKLTEWLNSHYQYYFADCQTVILETQMAKKLIFLVDFIAGFMTARGKQVVLVSPLTVKRQMGFTRTGESWKMNKLEAVEVCKKFILDNYLKFVLQDGEDYNSWTHDQCDSFLLFLSGAKIVK